ncbi:phenylacetate-CoA ligase [Lutibacter oceani]|uniref:Phenylacetate-CoA ligase n=1 Tax=Lutibacter oceani TaxID=1853311 RepID=A0A3D9RPV3_9FLAO|nr:phenylacetate--CoA ligase family protein [Lutibacter oceani]REE81973.1 phenylacetate-CoA ligase [Lutibacter oceani]
MLKKVIFKLGQKLRNPSLNNWFSFLKKSESWTLKELENYQLLKLKELVSVAYNNSKFYRNLFEENGLSPSDINSLADLKKIPIISKEDLITKNKDIQVTLKATKFFKASTSGTTGQALNFLKDEFSDSFNRASMFRGYSWYKVNPWDKNGYFWGYNFSSKEKLKTRGLDVLQNRFRIFNFNDKQLKLFSNKLHDSVYVHGYSSAIYETAKKINRQHFNKPLNLKMVKGTSEKIYERYQDEIKKAFGQKMISEYGAAETGIIAFECPSGNMHINMEGVIVEEINEEIIITNLQMQSFPVIRYRLGDYVKLAPENKECACGLKHLIIEEVTGRIGAIVYGEKLTYPSLYFYYIFKNLAKQGVFLNYQIVQNIKGKLNFFIEQDLSMEHKKLLENEIERYFKKDLKIKINTNFEFKTREGKHKSFISNIL